MEAVPVNILTFGPNGSGKGTQGSLVKKKYNLAHIESGAIFREHIGGGTELGKKAKAYIDKGELVPDEITIPMILETLKAKGGNGWLLDGFPRNMVQAEKLWEALQKEGMLPAPVLTAAQESLWVAPGELSQFAFPAGHRKLIDSLSRDLRLL